MRHYQHNEVSMTIVQDVNLLEEIKTYANTQGTNYPIVNSYNEWDPLEEVIVGVVEGATIPDLEVAVKATIPEDQIEYFQKNAGKKFPQEAINAAAKELEEFVNILEGEGITVRRPDKINQARSYGTQEWQSKGGLYQAMPRDLLIVIGDQIIESPLAWRSRYFEIFSFREMLKDYFKKGGKWVAAPKPELPDHFYRPEYVSTGNDDEYAINEFEPTFDAADFIRCGRDIFVQKSNVTNDFGIDWLARQIGDKFRVHKLKFTDSHPMHVDATFMPLAPGHLLLNPERATEIPSLFKSWNIMYSPKSTLPKSHPMYMSSSWVNMNILMLDEKRVVVERQEQPLIDLFKKNGFEPILCDFRNFYSFGGGFHCATVDVRRRGGLQSYV